MSQSLDSIYDDPHYNIFLKTVGANDEHMSRFPINVVRTIRNRVIRFVGTDSSCSSNIKDIMMWLKCLAKVLQDSKYIIYNDSNGIWTLKFDESFLLLQNWIVVLFKVRNMCKRAEYFKNDILGREFDDLCGQFLGTKDWYKWLSDRRNIIAHGGEGAITVDPDRNFQLTFQKRNGHRWTAGYLHEFNAARKFAFLIFILFDDEL